MILRQKISIAGAIAGFFYTGIGLAGAYNNAPVTETTGTIIFQFFIFSIFTVPFCALIGMGIGFLVEGLINLIKSK
jgi:hypothetical protein